MDFKFEWSPPYEIVQLDTLKLGYLIFAIPTCQKSKAYSRRELSDFRDFFFNGCYLNELIKLTASFLFFFKLSTSYLPIYHIKKKKLPPVEVGNE